MNRPQGIELLTLINAVRHVEEMDVTNSPSYVEQRPNVPACPLAEGMRHGLYSLSEVQDRDGNPVFYKLFGCTLDESIDVIFHNYADTLTGETFYQAVKELLEKYGYGDLFNDSPETTLSFSDLMDELKQPVVA